MQTSLLGVRQVQLLHGPGGTHVAKATLFLHAGCVAHRPAVRKKALFQPAHENHGKFQALGRVQRHQLQAVAAVGDLRDRLTKHLNTMEFT